MTGLPSGPGFYALARDTGKMRRHFPHVVAIMTAQGHLLFSVTCTLLAHKLQLTPALADASLWHTVPAALASALLPDLDHPKSVLGQRLPWISKPLSRLFGHRGFTHSLLAVAAAIWGWIRAWLPPYCPPASRMPSSSATSATCWRLAHPGRHSAAVAQQAPLPAAGLAAQERWRGRDRLCTLTLLAAGYWAHWPG